MPSEFARGETSAEDLCSMGTMERGVLIGLLR